MITMADSSNPPEAILRQAYDGYLSELWLRRTKTLCWIAMAAIPTGVVLDYFIYHPHFSAFVLVRLVTVILLAGIVVLLNLPNARKYPKQLGFLWMTLTVGHLTTMISMATGVFSPYYLGIIAVIVGACLLMPWTFKECCAACGMTWTLYAIACMANWVANGPPEAAKLDVAVSNAFFMALFAGVGMACSYVAEGFRFREFKLRFDLDQNKRELEASYKKLSELDQAKSHFFANISHELRTPLTLILSPLDQLRSALPASAETKFRETIEIMHSNALRLLARINDLLDLVQLDEKRLSLNLQPIDLKVLLPGLVDSIRGAAERARLSMETHLDASSPLVVLADRDRLEKIFINLLFNAIKFTPPGGAIRVTGRQEEGMVSVDVQDTGVGIAEDKLREVFSRFWQEDGSSTRVRQGTGLGLALVKELAELHKGQITVRSKKGVGSTFTVRLPRYEGVPEAPVSERADETWISDLFRKAQQHREELTPLDQAAAGGGQARDNFRHTLLLVEDEPAMQKFLWMELQEAYNVVVASDGHSGYEMAHQHQPKLIVTDLMLPKTDGITLCRKLKSSPTLLPTKIVLLTARADDRTKLAALEAGADDFLTKPFSTVELKTRLANLLLTSQLERELQSQNQVLESTLKQLRATEAQLIQTERLSALGNLSAGIMHEINNPINFLLTAVHVLRSSIPSGSREAVNTINDIESGLKRIRDIIADLRSFAYGGTSTGKTDCAARKILRTARRLLAHEITDDIKFEEGVSGDARLYGNENQLVQLLVNLVQNALQATATNPSKSRVRHVRVSMEPQGIDFVLSVWDNGAGISKENLPKLFDPFFTTKPVGEGMGLGLSICHTIVKQHGGQISVKSEPDAYSEFVVRLPLHPAGAVEPLEAATPFITATHPPNNSTSEPGS